MARFILEGQVVLRKANIQTALDDFERRVFMSYIASGSPCARGNYSFPSSDWSFVSEDIGEGCPCTWKKW